jgi:glycosyltransferase involved in cell wall biosynthesis
MKVLIINYNDTKGGAAIATYRIHKSLLKLGVNSRFLVYRKFSNDKTVEGPENIFVKYYRLLRQRFSSLLYFPFIKTKNVFNSASFLSSNLSKFINDSDYDIVHLNWINYDFISIEDIAKISKPIIWTLHDMWAFCGAEHLSWDIQYIDGYKKKLLFFNMLNIDLNSIVWERKKKSWKNPIHIVTPSKWLSDCVNKSFLMKDWPTTIINNPIDTKLWHNIGRNIAREKYGFKSDEKIIFFSTSESLKNYNKGFDLLLESLITLRNLNFKLLIIGPLEKKLNVVVPFNFIFFDKINSENKLIELYSCANLVVIPSRQESLSYVAIEALTCSCPVVAFDNSGIKDVVKHMENGYLARAYDTTDFANGIELILNNDQLAESFSNNGRQFSLSNLDQNIIAAKYKDLYSKIINQRKYYDNDLS